MSLNEHIKITKTDSFIKSRIKWKAGGYKLSSNLTVYYKDLSLSLKEFYDQQIKNLNIGTPVLLFTRKRDDSWTIIGTQKVVWYSIQKISSLDYLRFQFMATNDIYELKYNGETELNPIKKLEWDELTVLDTENNKLKIPSYNGSDFFALWNILLMVTNLTKN